jgi:hypothetical protein
LRFRLRGCGRVAPDVRAQLIRERTTGPLMSGPVVVLRCCGPASAHLMQMTTAVPVRVFVFDDHVRRQPTGTWPVVVSAAPIQSTRFELSGVSLTTLPEPPTAM